MWRTKHIYDTERGERIGLGDAVEAEIVSAGARKSALTAIERERASAALCVVVDFASTDAQSLYRELSEADSTGPWAIVGIANDVELIREPPAAKANRLWHEHSYYLELMGLDIMPLLRTLEGPKNALLDADEAHDWPVNAQLDRARPVSQLMSDLGGNIGNIRRDAAQKRKEYLE